MNSNKRTSQHVRQMPQVQMGMQSIESTRAGTGFPWPFFALAYAFTWLVLLAGYLMGRVGAPLLAFVAVAQFGPSLAAFGLTIRSGGWPAAARLARRALAFRMPLPWLATTLLLPAVLAAVAFYLNTALGNPAPKTPLLAQPIAIVPTFLFILLLQGPVPEEFGWRGYALDRLQARWPALTSSVVLGLIWAAWHLPLFYLPGVSQSYMPFWSFAIMTVALAVLITWVYNNTGRNLFAVLIFHAGVNLWSFGVFPPLDLAAGASQTGFYVLTVLYVAAAVAVTLVWGRRTLSRESRVRAEPPPQGARPIYPRGV